MCSILFFLHFFSFILSIRQVYGFDFIVSPPTQCGAQRFTWVGGTPPFTALMIVPDGTMRSASIPADAWNAQDQSGDFATILNLAQGQKVVFSMSDATGVTAGGLTDVMTVGAAAAGSQSCNTTDPGTNFFFATDSPLSQCKNYPFTLFAQSGAVQPITILVTVPHGESFLLHPPPGDPFVWKANLTAGTSVMFTMTDSQNRVGGTSSLLNVGASDDSSCVRPLPASASPTRLPSTPTSSLSLSPTNTQNDGSKNRNSDKATSSNTGIIVGASVGGAVALLIIIALIYFFTKRNGGHGSRLNRIDLTEPGPDSSTYLLPPGQQQHQSQYPPTMNPFTPYHDNVMATSYQAGPSGVPPTMMYNNFPAGPSPISDAAMGGGGMGNATTATAGFVGATAATGAMGAQGYQPPMTAKQRDAMQLQQQHNQQQAYIDAHQTGQQHQQSYFNPYETGMTSPAASSSAFQATSKRQTAQSVSEFGMSSASNFSTSAGPSTTSSAQSSKPLLSSSSTQPPRRFIVHTDIEDEPIELPPVYSESREPIPGMTPANATPPRKGMQ